MRMLAIAAAMATVLTLPAAAEASPTRLQYLQLARQNPYIGDWKQGYPRSHRSYRRAGRSLAMGGVVTMTTSRS